MNKHILSFIFLTVLILNVKAQCPTLTVVPSLTICQNNNLNLTASASIACTYSWSSSTTPQFTSTMQNPTIANVNPSLSGSYTVVATFTSPSCQSSAVVNVSVISVPSIAVTPTITVCERQGANFTANAANALTYLWSGPNSFTMNSPNPIFANLTPSMSGIYTVTATFISGTFTCYNSNQTALTVKPAPTLIHTNDSLFCTNQTPNPIATLTVSGADTYTWGTSSTATSIVVSPTATTNYMIAGTYTSNGCIAQDIITLTLADCTGIPQFSDEKSNIIVYPNPNSGEFTIDIPSESSIIITDIMGKLIFDNRLKSGSNNINLDSFPTGVYFLKINSDSSSRTIKFIKE